MIYFDQDGVLVSYDKEIYNGDNPIWLKKNEHIFLKQKADEKMKTVFNEIYKFLGEYVCVLTAVQNFDVVLKNEHIIDKWQWMLREYPEFDMCNFITCDSSKMQAISKIKGTSLSKKDILIDDYNKNLYAWINAGGTAIKYGNNINSKGYWPGLFLKPEDSPEVIIETILKIWYEVNN